MTMDVQSTVAEKNKKFEEASAADKRVMIAEEVLRLLAVGNIVPKRGHYIGTAVASLDGEFIEDFGSETLKERKDETIHDLIPSFLSGCCVCAIGSACLALGNLKTDLKLGRLFGSSAYLSGSTMQDVLARYFSPKEVDGMEYTFEESDNSPDDSLRSIMENIVANKGFVAPYTGDWE